MKLQFVINGKTLHLLSVLFIGSSEVGPDIDLKFVMVMIKIVRYDTNISCLYIKPLTPLSWADTSFYEQILV